MKIAICCNTAGGLLAPEGEGNIGGMQVRAYVFARRLAQGHEHDVSFVIPNAREPRRYRKDGIEVVELPFAGEHSRGTRLGADVLSHWEPLDTFPWMRIHRWGPALPWYMAVGAMRQISYSRDVRQGYSHRVARALRRLHIDVACCFKPSAYTADMVMASRRMRRPAVTMIANDVDLGDHVYRGSREQGPKGTLGDACWRSIAHADEVVVQTTWQQQRLRERFEREGVLIRNPIDLTCRAADEPPAEPPYVLWIGRGDTEHKRPTRCFELAARCPDVRFVMVMNPENDERQAQLKRDAPANVRIIDRVPFDEIETYFKHASVFVSTSAFEGFPNTFLQAGKYAVPILSLAVDPDAMLTGHGAGVVCDENVERMAAALRELMCDESRRRTLGEAARGYVHAHHDLEGRVRELESLLTTLAEGP